MNPQSRFGQSSWKQWVAAFAASSIFFNESFLDIPWRAQLDHDQYVSGLIISIFIVLIGAFLGAVFADVFGRKKTLLGALIFVIPRMVRLVFAEKNWIWIVNIFTEFGSGITCTVVPLYISEIASTGNRATLMIIQPLTQAIGMFVIIGLQFLTINSEDYTGDYIIDGVTLGITALFHGIVIAIFPETPQYLNSKNNYQEAAHSLAFFREMSHVKIRGESHELPTPYTRTNIKNRGCCGKLSELFRFANRRSLAIIFSLLAIRWASGQNRNETLLLRGVAFWENDYRYYVIIGVFAIQLFFTAVITLTIDIFKRKISVILVILVGLIATVVGIVALGSDGNFAKYIYFGVFLIQDFVHYIILGVTLAYMGELFPTDVRALAIATVLSFGMLMRNLCISFDYKFLFHIGSLTISSAFERWVCIWNSPVYFIGLIFVAIFFPRVNKLPCSEIEIETPAGIQSLS